VFGRVVSGQDVVDAIEKVRTGNRGGHSDVPLDDVTITRATVVS
jgi:peptidyl-prolyl cis-trans isomerase B (cyclophilin B)